MLAIHDPAGSTADLGIHELIESLKLAMGTERGIELIRGEILRGRIRVLPARGGGLTIVPVPSSPRSGPGGIAAPRRSSRT